MITGFSNLVQLTTYFSDEAKCRLYLANLRWEDGEPICPHCGHEKVYTFKDGKTCKCAQKECKKRFSVTVGTIFENTKIPLRKWFIGIYLITSHKKGISSHQLAKDLGVTQKPAWFILQRVRDMLKENAPELLSGEVEIDETFVGGKEKNKRASKHTKGTQGRSTLTKTPVLGLLERSGELRLQLVKGTKRETLQPIMRNAVVEGSTAYTDERKGYIDLGEIFDHQTINHGGKEYVRDLVSTNGIENFWSIFKRGLIGIYHHCSEKHLERYCDEFAYRYNTRELAEEERFDHAISQASGRRLTYAELIKQN